MEAKNNLCSVAYAPLHWRPFNSFGFWLNYVPILLSPSNCKIIPRSHMGEIHAVVLDRKLKNNHKKYINNTRNRTVFGHPQTFGRSGSIRRQFSFLVGLFKICKTDYCILVPIVTCCLTAISLKSIWISVLEILNRKENKGSGTVCIEVRIPSKKKNWIIMNFWMTLYKSV